MLQEKQRDEETKNDGMNHNITVSTYHFVSVRHNCIVLAASEGSSRHRTAWSCNRSRLLDQILMMPMTHPPSPRLNTMTDVLKPIEDYTILPKMEIRISISNTTGFDETPTQRGMETVVI